MKRTFSSPPARELLTRDQSSGGSYRLTSSADLIAYHRKLKNRTLTNWPARIHRLLTFGIALSLLAIVVGIYRSLGCESAGHSKTAEGCFTVAVCASVAFACCVLAKCYWNSKYPPKS